MFRTHWRHGAEDHRPPGRLSEFLATRINIIRDILPDSSRNNTGQLGKLVSGRRVSQARSANVVKTRGEVANLASPPGSAASGQAAQDVPRRWPVLTGHSVR